MNETTINPENAAADLLGSDSATAANNRYRGLRRGGFTKGRSGNPSGRPRGLIGPALNRKLKKFDPETREQVADLIADMLIGVALG